jgi:hypothetical protein
MKLGTASPGCKNITGTSAMPKKRGSVGPKAASRGACPDA